MISEIRAHETASLDHEIRAVVIRRISNRADAARDFEALLGDGATLTAHVHLGEWHARVASKTDREEYAEASGDELIPTIRAALHALARWHDGRAKDLRETARDLIETFTDIAA